MAKKAEKKKEKVNPDLPPIIKGQRLTNGERKLSPRELAFIDKYIETSNARQSAIYAGYSEKTADVKGSQLLSSIRIATEIRRRVEKRANKSIANAQQVMEFFTKVMNGEILDQFGLEAPLSERTKAAVELAKRTVDLENRLNGKPDAKLEIKLDWGNDDEE